MLAVSGGVDSMVLLHALADVRGVQLTVAHYDHGIRADSAEDRVLVQETAQKLGLPFVYDMGQLGSNASEAAARKARYAFLERIRTVTQSQAIITAHHQDDMLETAILNMLRGTGRKGLSALRSRTHVVRPMLHLNKDEIIAYAKKHNIRWREDSTNEDERYLRNYVRNSILPKFSASDRQLLLQLVLDTKELNQKIDTLLESQMHVQSRADKLDRHWFISLPHHVSAEVLAHWLREYAVENFDKKTIQRLETAGKTMAPGKRVSVSKTVVMEIGKDFLALKGLDR